MYNRLANTFLLLLFAGCALSGCSDVAPDNTNAPQRGDDVGADHVGETGGPRHDAGEQFADSGTSSSSDVVGDTAKNDASVADALWHDSAEQDAHGTDAGAADAATVTADAHAPGTDGGFADSTDAGPVKICPGPTKPKAGADVGVVPEPDTSQCKWPQPDFFKGATPPAPTLQVEAGQVDAAGKFHAFQSKQWVPMDHGVQGGFHLTVAVRLKVPGATDNLLKVQVEPYLYAGCKLTGFGNAPIIYPKKVDGGWHQLGNKLSPGVQVRFGTPGSGNEIKSGGSFDFCNEWYELRVAARDMKTQKWGKTSVRLRTYDTKQK